MVEHSQVDHCDEGEDDAAADAVFHVVFPLGDVFAVELKESVLSAVEQVAQQLIGLLVEGFLFELEVLVFQLALFLWGSLLTLPPLSFGNQLHHVSFVGLLGRGLFVVH